MLGRPVAERASKQGKSVTPALREQRPWWVGGVLEVDRGLRLPPRDVLLSGSS